jgi:hypothetical protein
VLLESADVVRDATEATKELKVLPSMTSPAVAVRSRMLFACGALGLRLGGSSVDGNRQEG